MDFFAEVLSSYCRFCLLTSMELIVIVKPYCKTMELIVKPYCKTMELIVKPYCKTKLQLVVFVF